MKHQKHTVDARIKHFMKRKMVEFPELKEKYGPRVEVVMRSYMWEDVASFFSKLRRGVQ